MSDLGLPFVWSCVTGIVAAVATHYGNRIADQRYLDSQYVRKETVNSQLSQLDRRISDLETGQLRAAELMQQNHRENQGTLSTIRTEQTAILVAIGVLQQQLRGK